MVSTDAKTIYQEGLAYGAFIPFAQDINPEVDKQFESKYVTLRNCHEEEYSTHLVETYLITQGRFIGRMYHLFTHVDGKIVMNFTPDDYYNLSEFIDISFMFTIFQKDDNEIFPLPISPDYRLRVKR